MPPVQTIQILQVSSPTLELIKADTLLQEPDRPRLLREVAMIGIVQCRAYIVSNENWLFADYLSGEGGRESSLANKFGG